MKLFAGSSHIPLAQSICEAFAIPLGKIFLNQFPDGESHVQILEDVRGEDVFVLQSIAFNPNHYLVELLIIIDALKRGAAKSITVIIPYLGYCRQDRKDQQGTPITAKLVATLLERAGINHLITFDLHSTQVEGFFETTFSHLHCQELLLDEAQKFVGDDYVIVAPDTGSIKIAENAAKKLNKELVVVMKKRLNLGKVDVSVIGNVNNKNILIIDDMCSTGDTLVEAANACKKQGAKKMVAMITHGLFVGNAIKKIELSNLDLVLTTNTVPLIERPFSSEKIKVFSIHSLLIPEIKER